MKDYLLPVLLAAIGAVPGIISAILIYIKADKAVTAIKSEVAETKVAIAETKVAVEETHKLVNGQSAKVDALTAELGFAKGKEAGKAEEKAEAKAEQGRPEEGD